MHRTQIPVNAHSGGLPKKTPKKMTSGIKQRHIVTGCRVIGKVSLPHSEITIFFYENEESGDSCAALKQQFFLILSYCDQF